MLGTEFHRAPPWEDFAVAEKWRGGLSRGCAKPRDGEGEPGTRLGGDEGPPGRSPHSAWRGCRGGGGLAGSHRISRPLSHSLSMLERPGRPSHGGHQCSKTDLQGTSHPGGQLAAHVSSLSSPPRQHSAHRQGLSARSPAPERFSKHVCRPRLVNALWAQLATGKGQIELW